MADDRRSVDYLSALHRALDELDGTRAELEAARADLVAMADRMGEIERRAELGVPSQRAVANSELKARRRRLEAREQRFRRLSRFLSKLGILDPVERTARRLRAKLRG
jgi:soluble P-type ATPase